ncbi:MAG: 4-alpha-glucanotransferase, partial [Candidatus Cryptobacteroides sp.]
EYKTRWGEELVLCSKGRRYPMSYASDGMWEVEVGDFDAESRYHYEVYENGFMTRREWGCHRLSSGKPVGDGCTGDLAVEDAWTDVPEHLPQRSFIFADGKMRKAGTAVPVFSLRSEEDFGVGEFRDIMKLVDWCAATGQSVIQLLPVNDTVMNRNWEDSYPYNANSSFALHPQFIHLPDAGVCVDREYRRLRKELNSLPSVDYEKVNSLKERLLRKAFTACGEEVLKSAEYKGFVRENSLWLMPYAAFRVLRDDYGTADFRQWGEFASYSARKVKAFCAQRKEDVGFHCFVQFHLHCQLRQARDYARSKGVILKGDLPIGISATSADAWMYPELFNLDSCAGAPPDFFSADGQNWGFPTYNWERMEKDDFAWWKARLGKMSEYFDAFRIDHILGFFRIWEIPVQYRSGMMGHFSPALPYSAKELTEKGFDLSREYACPQSSGTDVLFLEDPSRKGYYHPCIGGLGTKAFEALPDGLKQTFRELHGDFFFHRHDALWRQSALRKLPELLSSCGMIACGEDLGMIPGCVAPVMSELQILSLEIERMPKTFGDSFADTSRYPYLSVSTTSTHDITPLRAWWQEEPDAARRYLNDVLGIAGEPSGDCGPQICRRILERTLDSPSMFAILPLQDWLSIDGGIRRQDPSEERINIPSVYRHLWRYRMHIPLESLLENASFNSAVLSLVQGSGRC